jgi:hypothetical protein
MLIAGGLFASAVVSIAWERIPAWRADDLSDFQTAFAHTLRRVDRLQPALLIVSLASTICFALSEDGGGAHRRGARRRRLPDRPPRLGSLARSDPASPDHI